MHAESNLPLIRLVSDPHPLSSCPTAAALLVLLGPLVLVGARRLRGGRRGRRAAARSWLRRRRRRRRGRLLERPEAEAGVLPARDEGGPDHVHGAHQPLVALAAAVQLCVGGGCQNAEQSELRSIVANTNHPPAETLTHLRHRHQPALRLHLQHRDAAARVARGEEEAVPALQLLLLAVEVVLHGELRGCGLREQQCVECACRC